MSTLWWAARVARIISVEHDEAWAARISQYAPHNAEIRFRPLVAGQYVSAILDCDVRFDVIVVDGIERVACLRQAVARLSPAGVILLDNSQRQEYEEGVAYLKDIGFRNVSFSGLVPVVAWKEQTSLFYRSNNVLEL